MSISISSKSALLALILKVAASMLDKKAFSNDLENT